MASVYLNKGNFQEAELKIKEAININERIVSVKHINYLNCLNTLALIYDHIGNYLQAEQIYNNLLLVIKKEYGDEHPLYITCLNNLTVLYTNKEDYSNAELIHKKILAIHQKELGREHPLYIISLNNLAEVYFYMRNYMEAERLYKESLDITRKIFGVNHPKYANNLEDLANIYRHLGNYDLAESYIKRSLEIKEYVFGKESIEYSHALYSMLLLHMNKNEYWNAERLCRELMYFYNTINSHEDPLFLNILDIYGAILKFQKNYLGAEIYFKNILKSKKEKYGENSIQYSMSLNDLASLYLDMGLYNYSEQYYLKSIEILKNKKDIKREFIPISNLAALYELKQDFFNAEKFNIKSANIIRNNIKTNFQYLSEKERQLYWNTQSHYFNIYYPSFCYSYYPQKKSISEFAYNNAILTKGLLLNASTQVQNAILNSGNQTLIDQWNELCGLRQQIVFLQNKTLEEQENAGIAALEERANELDKQLTASSSEFKQGKEIWNIEWNDVKKKLKSNEVAIEFISFDYYHKGEFTDSTLYCALLLRNNSQYPEMITLFEEKELSVFANKTIDGKVASNLIYSFFVNEEDGDTTGYGMKLSQLVWSKILPKIKEGETVYFSPSGLFHQLAIESLPYDENRRMSDVYNLVRLSSTREIVLNKNNTNQYSTATLYGGIHYDTSTKDLLAESSNYSQETLLASRGVENDTLDRGSVNYLPGTKQEAEKINKMLVDNNITAQLYTMSQANEESFKNLSNKHQNIIHIGTHGFAWTDSVAKKKDYFAERMQMIGEDQQYRGPIIDPLNRCGLLFAGANIALQGKSRELPEGVQDGILTAKEISLLDLRDCDLVVLSACETAKGDVTSEGVFGLQRAFKMAGVQTIIMSLWKVNDEATQMLMTKFYNNWIVKKQEKREAFNNAQNAVRMKYAEPVYWAGFVMLD